MRQVINNISIFHLKERHCTLSECDILSHDLTPKIHWTNHLSSDTSSRIELFRFARTQDEEERAWLKMGETAQLILNNYRALGRVDYAMSPLSFPSRSGRHATHMLWMLEKSVNRPQTRLKIRFAWTNTTKCRARPILYPDDRVVKQNLQP